MSERSARVTGSGTDWAAAIPPESPKPNDVMMLPGASELSRLKLAEIEGWLAANYSAVEGVPEKRGIALWRSDFGC